MLQTLQDSDNLPQPALTDLPTFGFPSPSERDGTGSFGFRGLRPATQSSGRATTTTQNLTDNETLKRTFHDTANRCHQNSIRLSSGGSWLGFPPFVARRFNSCLPRRPALPHERPARLSRTSGSDTCGQSIRWEAKLRRRASVRTASVPPHTVS